MLANLTMPFGAGISKDDLIKNAYDDMISKHDERADKTLDSIEEEEEMIF